MDFSRLRTGEIVAAIGGVALLLFMFFDWYSGGPDIISANGADVPGADGWDSLTDFDGFLITLAALSGICLGLLAAAGKRIRLGGLPRGEVTAVLGTLASLLILWRMFAQPVPGADLKIGIFLGLAAAIAIAVGALMALREDGFEPVVSVPGGRTKARATASRATASSAAKPKAAAKRKPAKSRAKASASRRK